MKKRFFLVFLGFTLTFFLAVPVYADSYSFTFESPFTLGSIDSQFGWSSICSKTPYSYLDLNYPYQCDHFIETQDIYRSFGAQSLRISNALAGIDGYDIDDILKQTQSRSLGYVAGESHLFTDSAKIYDAFEMEFDTASVTQSPQTSLFVAISPSNEEGNRYSLVRVHERSDAGMSIYFKDYIKDPVTGIGSFKEYLVAQNLDRFIPHRIKLRINFIDGESNDVVLLYVDGVLVKTGTSWEDYYRSPWMEETPDGEVVDLNPIKDARTIDRILFKTFGENASPNIDNLNKGFYFDNIGVKSGISILPTDKKLCLNYGWQEYIDFTNQGECVSYVESLKK